MYMQHRMNSSALLFRFGILLVILRLSNISVNGQGREFFFNSPGNSCYFRYLCYTADSDYSLIRRPYIFILSDENVTPDETMARDTLKNSQRFSD
jgi:hypothetical protein